MNRASDAWSAVRTVDVGSTAGLSRSLIRLFEGHLPRTLLAAAGVAVSYAATAWLGTAYIFPGARVSALWFPNAILLAALLLSRRRDWWIYLALVLPAHFLTLPLLGSVPPGGGVIGYVGNCATAVVGALALSAFVPGIQRIDRLRTAIAFILLAGILAPLCTSLLVAAAAVAVGVTTTFWWTAVARSLSNAFAILTLVPLILHGAAWLRQRNTMIHSARAAEAAVLAITLATLGILAFLAPDRYHDFSPALLYAPFAI